MELQYYAYSFLIGVFLQSRVFSRNEWERHAPKIVFYSCLAVVGTFIGLTLGISHSFISALVETNVLVIALLGGLYASMITYRLLFHPLKAFPGPIAAKITAFWVIKQNIPDLGFYKQLRQLHDHYGDFVRIRPRELSIRHPDAVADVHGPRSKLRKGEFYEQTRPLQSLQLTRDPEYHKTQRKYWDRAFQNKALQEYTPRLVKHYTVLMNIFAQHATSGTPVDASTLILDLFFDIISDLTFGKSFNALSEKKRIPLIAEFMQQQKAVGYMFLNMWLYYLVKSLPVVQAKLDIWTGWYDRALKERQKMSVATPDLYSYISQSDHFGHDASQEAQLAVVAGADTNAITVTNTLSLLCQHPKYQTILYLELKDLPTNVDGLIDDQHLVGKPCLSGIINEVLRLHPPVPSGMQRLTPPEGAMIAGRFIPGDMIVTTPTWSLQRDARAFVHPDDFIPERWYSRPDLILRKDAFMAFGFGTYNCAGKPLALLQLRMVIAMIVKRFEISVPPGKEDDFQHFADDQSDCFTIHLSPLPLLLKERTSK